MNVDDARFSAVRIEIVGCFTYGIVNRTHTNDDLFRLRIAIIYKRFIRTPRQLSDLVHVIFNDIRQRFIVRVGRFFLLEENVRVLSRSAQHGVIRRQTALAERLNGFHVDETF